jgi:hypothetical protein
MIVNGEVVVKSNTTATRRKANATRMTGVFVADFLV